MASDIDLEDSFEACRTCGVFYLTNSKYLCSILHSENPKMLDILMELAGWHIEIKENDDLPKKICNSCIHSFQQFFKFRQFCRNVQNEFFSYNSLRDENKLQIKTERTDSDMDCLDIIYVDDLSDGEQENVTNISLSSIPIKIEPPENRSVLPELYSHLKDNNILYCSLNNKNSLNSGQNVIDCNNQFLPETIIKENVSTLKNVINTLPHKNSVVSNIENQESPSCTQNEIQQYECQICKKIFKNCTSHRIKFHLKWHARCKNLTRKKPNMQVNTKIIEHLKSNRINRRVECKYCQKFVPFRNIKKHYRALHTLRSKSSQEIYMESNFEEVGWHEHDSDENCEDISPQEEFVIMCSKCDRRFKNAEDLIVHASEHVSKDANHINNYSYCSENENAQNTSNPYNEEDTEIESYMDKTNSIGESDLSTEYDNEGTLPIDDDLITFKPFLCAHCTQSFARVDELRLHSQEHAKKIFKCHICDKIFDLKFSLNRHIKHHRTENI